MMISIDLLRRKGGTTAALTPRFLPKETLARCRQGSVSVLPYLRNK